MYTTETSADEVTAPFRARVAKSKALLVELDKRLATGKRARGNAEADQLRSLRPKLVAHIEQEVNNLRLVELLHEQLQLQEYVRSDGDAPLITRVLGFIAMADQRTRQETMSEFTAHGEKPYTIEDAVLQLRRKKLVSHPQRGVSEAEQDKAWKAIADTRARRTAGTTQRILETIEREGPIGRREILARFTREGTNKGAIDSCLQRLRNQRQVSTTATGRTTTYTIGSRAADLER